jgi:hypothetical protein
MKTTRRWQWLWTAGLGAGLLAATGCQTWVGGMTLPSGWYLQHPPQYIPPDPEFPLERELAAQEEAALIPPVGGALPPGPPPVGGPVPPPPPVGGPAPAPPVPAPPVAAPPP